MESESKEFSFFDSPDGQDLVPKLQSVAKPATIAAISLGTVDVALSSHPKGYLPTLARYLHFAWPVYGAAASFIVAGNIAGSLRKKDDPLNWAIGGACVGLIFGVWRKSVHKSVSSVVAGAAVGALYKYSLQKGYSINPPMEYTRPQIGGVWSVHQNWTLTKERPRNWSTE